MSEELRENSFDLATWLINFEFQDPKNRHMTYRELVRIYATKIEALITQELNKFAEELLENKTTMSHVTYDFGTALVVATDEVIPVTALTAKLDEWKEKER